MTGESRRLGIGAVVAVLALLVLGVVGLAGDGAGAQTQSDKDKVDQKITSAKDQVEEASAAEAKLLDDLDAAAARKKDLDGKVAAIDGQISVVQKSLNVAQAQLSQAEAEQRGAEARLGSAQIELAESRRQLAAYAVAAYTGRSQATQYLETTLRAHSMAELIAKRSYIKAVGNNQSELIAKDEKLRDEVKDLAVQADQAREEAASKRDAVAGERAKLQQNRDAQAVVQQQVAAEVSKIDALHAEAVSRKSEFEAQVKELEAQSASIEAALRKRAEEQRAAALAANAAGAGAAVPTAPASPGAGGLVNPVPGAPITSPFGYRIHPIYGDTRLHTGVDFGIPEGTALRAAGSGVVVTAAWMSGYGNATIIDHGNGLATLYGHQSALGVSEGQRVTQGQVIGRSGCTGSCTGPHLHFEVRVNGTPVDPMPYIS